MRSSTLVAVFFSTIVTLAVTNFAALQFSLYSQYSWFDNPVHVLGGVGIALAVFMLPLFHARMPERYFTLVPIIFFVLIVGFAWELFEVTIGVPHFEANFASDMITDLVLDVLGGIIGYFVGNRIRTL